jgi:hypothetical protein
MKRRRGNLSCESRLRSTRPPSNALKFEHRSPNYSVAIQIVPRAVGSADCALVVASGWFMTVENSEGAL